MQSLPKQGSFEYPLKEIKVEKHPTAKRIIEKYEKFWNLDYEEIAVIYGITWEPVKNLLDIKLQVRQNLDKILEIKIGKSKLGNFKKRFAAYYQQSGPLPLIIFTMPVPPFLNLDNEENRIIEHFKTRIYKGQEYIKASVNEVSDYYENRQHQIYDMRDEILHKKTGLTPKEFLKVQKNYFSENVERGI